MPLLQTPRDRAVALILLLAVAIAIALTPFVSGLLGAGVLYVIFVHPYQWLARIIKPGIAAAIMLVVALILVALPLTWLVGLVIAQAPDALHRIQSSDVLARVSQLRTGQFDIGAEIVKSSGTLIAWLSSHIVAFAGGATSAALNIVIAFFGLYYILLSGPQMWVQARVYIPFSTHTADALRDRFFAVTAATLTGTALVAVVQGSIIGFAFRLVDLPNPLFWGSRRRLHVGPSGHWQHVGLASRRVDSSRAEPLRRGRTLSRDQRRHRGQRGQSHPAPRVQADLQHSPDDHARGRVRRSAVLRSVGTRPRAARHRLPLRAAALLP